MVHYSRHTRPSARVLHARLRQEGYRGRPINFGLGVRADALNSPGAIAKASNKRIALGLMSEAGVPIPRLIEHTVIEHDSQSNLTIPMVGRPDSHRQGRGFWLCNNVADVRRAVAGRRKKRPATHFMEYIKADKEFRVHVINGQSYKISEKVGEGLTKNKGAGAVCRYPYGFNHKRTLRKVAKDAVKALGLDFGAVDVLWNEERGFFVLEVNTAPCLTDENSNTLDIYVQAIMREYGNDDYLGVRQDTHAGRVAFAGRGYHGSGAVYS